ncbi:sensor histidine kinase [Spirosoma endophyticum]|uniref:histidine kinase n=1 Tax=Spirosoma endophyticum TaxID=662367 RepID=A0A1I1EXV8_9BACT|nr:response regulator [Spirosoma endophyticum]SFB91492.1 His Kinase A (phospho-acceptor) domain-containing protein [Spirosoma endophyticum]
MILIVDDRRENILPLKKILELHRFSVDSAESGEEALKKVLKNAYSVIILDVQMPGMDGFEVANAIAGFSGARDTSIIFLSAVNTEKKFITKGYTSGGVDYLTKPVDPDILVLKVKTLQKLYEQQQELRATQDSLRKEVEVRKQAQEALSERMEELQKVLASLPQMAFTMAPSGKLEYVNEHWFRYSASATDFPENHPDDERCGDWKTAFANGKEFTREVRLKELSTGTYCYHLLRIVPIKQQDVVIRWIGTFTDIHSQKEAAELLEQQVELRTNELLLKNVELERTNHELQQFTWVVSHDLKEPLRKIQLLSDTIKVKYLRDNPDAVSYLDRAIRSAARMSTMINDLLAYSKLSVPENFQSTNLNTLLDEILLDFDDTISQKKAIITIDELPILETIPSRMRQIFQNLISNALKFAREDEAPRIRISAERIDNKAIDASPSPNGTYCRLIVQDNGIGFDEKFLDRIFIIFQRLHNRASYEGTGIGLAITKKNIEKHNGLISAQSRMNEGARFILILPIEQSK